jgi:Ca2+/Na+ antiporter
VMGLTLLAAGTSVPDALAGLFVARDGELMYLLYWGWNQYELSVFSAQCSEVLPTIYLPPQSYVWGEFVYVI